MSERRPADGRRASPADSRSGHDIHPRSPPPGGTLAPANAIRSYILHADRPGEYCCFETGDFKYYRGTVDFGERILAVVTSDASLDASDFLGASGTAYPTLGQREARISSSRLATQTMN